MTTPFFSVVVPVRDGAAHLDRCLRSLRGSTFTDWEAIVIDDGSSDGSADVARALGARVVRVEPVGRTKARNLGARMATGEYLLFLDADCEVHGDTLERAAAVLRAEPDLDGLFGSYDDSPDAPGLVSQFKNLFHHHVHQGSREEASTFWTGCGAIRRTTFGRLGGFRGVGPRSYMEDVELGLRLRADGGRMRLAKRVQVKHLKSWTLASLLRTDLLQRALPWARLIAERRGLVDELNLRRRERVSGTLAVALMVTMVLALRESAALAALPILAGGLLWLNRELYTFLRRRRGLRFAIASVPLHWAYFVNGALGLGLGLAVSFTRSRRPRSVSSRAEPRDGEHPATILLESGSTSERNPPKVQGNDAAA